MLVCADGQGVNVRSGPTTGATVVKLLPDLEKVRAIGFILTQPGDAKLEKGQGWYRISTPVEGWIRADFVTDAFLKTCERRNQFVNGR